MSRKTLTSNLSNEHLQTSLCYGELPGSIVRIPKYHDIYMSADKDGMIYIVETGQVKLTMVSSNGKECLLAIYTTGEMFGELSLCSSVRMETATAMEDTVVKRVPIRVFLQYVSSEKSRLNCFIQYLTLRLMERQQVIFDFVVFNSEYRFAQALLHLSEKLGEKFASDVRIEHRITHEELSQLVGTTRPRISEFMNEFRQRGLIEISAERFLIIKRTKLTNYLTRIM